MSNRLFPERMVLKQVFVDEVEEFIMVAMAHDQFELVS